MFSRSTGPRSSSSPGLTTLVRAAAPPAVARGGERRAVAPATRRAGPLMSRSETPPRSVAVPCLPPPAIDRVSRRWQHAGFSFAAGFALHPCDVLPQRLLRLGQAADVGELRSATVGNDECGGGHDHGDDAEAGPRWEVKEVRHGAAERHR